MSAKLFIAGAVCKNVVKLLFVKLFFRIMRNVIALHRLKEMKRKQQAAVKQALGKGG